MNFTRRTMTRFFRHISQFRVVLLTGMLVTVAAHAAADTIELKNAARLPDDATEVQLRHIATLDGPQATLLGSLVVAPLHPQARPLQLSVDLVRQKLDDAGVHWGVVNLTGRTVTVRPSRAQVRGTMLVAMQGVDVSGGSVTHLDGQRDDADSVEVSVDEDDERRSAPSMKRVGALASDLVMETTIRGEMARHCVRSLGLSARDVRLEFDPADSDWVSADRLTKTIELAMSGRWQDDRLVIEALIWDEQRMVESKRLNIWPRVRATVLTLTEDVRRDHVLTSQDFEATEAWMTLHEADRLVGADAAIGMIVTDRMPSGRTLYRTHLRGQTVIRRGDLIHVRCLVGGVALTVDAEARADGAVGDVIEVRKRGERETFLATVSGPNEAIFDLRKSQR